MEYSENDYANNFYGSNPSNMVNMSNGNGFIPPAPPQSSHVVTTYSNTTTLDQPGTFVPVPVITQVIFPPPGIIQPTATSSFEETTYHEQYGRVILGPGSQKEALLLGLGLPRLSPRQRDDLANAKKYAMEQSIKHVLMKQAVAHQQHQQKMTQYSQALSLMGRVYVGSISFELREESIKNAFSPFGPLKSVNMSWDPMTGHHKGFAFLEYELPEAAQLAQEQMNGVLLGGRNLKVGRPSNMSQAQNIVEMIKSEADDYHRIYVSSIHPDLSEQDVKSVFEAFGTIRSIDLSKGSMPGKHRGYAYIDFETEQAAVDAVASMNLFDLGGQFLRVGRAITPPFVRDYVPIGSSSTLPTASAVAAAAVTAKLQAFEATVAPKPQPPQVVVAGSGSPPSAKGLGGQVFLIPPPGVAVPQLTPPSVSPANSAGSNSPALFPTEFQPSTAAVAVTQPSDYVKSATPASNFQIPPPAIYESPVPGYGQGLPQDTGREATGSFGMSPVIVLRNMVGPEDVDETLEDEVAEECSRFGRVENVVVYQDRSNDAVKIFVKFSTVQEADSGRSNLDGRYFSGRQIEALFYDQNLFEHSDFSQ